MQCVDNQYELHSIILINSIFRQSSLSWSTHHNAFSFMLNIHKVKKDNHKKRMFIFGKIYIFKTYELNIFTQQPVQIKQTFKTKEELLITLVKLS